MDVKVIELVSGRVATGLITVPTLDDTSIYKPLEPTLQNREKEAGIRPIHLDPVNVKLTTTFRNKKMQKPEVFARAVVKSVLSPSPSLWIYKGNVATMSWIFSTFAPKWAIVSTPVFSDLRGESL